MINAAILKAPTAPRWRVTRRHAAGFALAAVTVAIFAGWFVVTRLGVTHALGIWDVTMLRFGIGAVLLAPAVLRKGSRIPPAGWLKGLLLSALWGVPFVLLLAFGLRSTAAAVAASTTPTLMPVFAGMLGAIFLGERQGAARWIGYGLIVLALVLMFRGAGSAVASASGFAALVAAALTWALYTILFRHSGLKAVQAAALICIWSTVVFLPVYLAFGLSRLAAASPGEIALQAVYQGVLMSAIAVVTFNGAVSLLGPAAATAVIALVPAVATLMAVPVLHEVPPPAELATIALVVAGALLAARTPLSSPKLAPPA
jgi:drug/metabolite transporter (DMT)-like permease